EATAFFSSSYLVDYRRFEATRRQQGLARVLRAYCVPERPHERPWRPNAHPHPSRTRCAHSDYLAASQRLHHRRTGVHRDLRSPDLHLLQGSSYNNGRVPYENLLLAIARKIRAGRSVAFRRACGLASRPIAILRCGPVYTRR
ncbi:hypothetical protein EXIGLDRAFT_840989, partial [Exidia glandulosa HHB12029]